MLEKIKKLYVKHKVFILFALFGIPPTLISFAAYLFCVYMLKTPGFVGNMVAWVVGVITGFFLYRKHVFHSSETTAKGIFAEFMKYVSMRVTSGLMETGLVFLLVDYLGFHKMIFKVLSSLCAALLNYLISTVFVFKNRKEVIRKKREIE